MGTLVVFLAFSRTALVRMFKLFAASSALVAAVNAHGNHQETLKEGPHKSLWYNTLPGDGGTQADSVFSGISTFGRIENSPCLANDDVKYDIAFLGAPFDGDQLQAWCSLWSFRYPPGQPQVEFIRRLQCASRCKPFPRLGEGHRLWRCARHFFRQRMGDPAD